MLEYRRSAKELSEDRCERLWDEYPISSKYENGTFIGHPVDAERDLKVCHVQILHVLSIGCTVQWSVRLII